MRRPLPSSVIPALCLALVLGPLPLASATEAEPPVAGTAASQPETVELPEVTDRLIVKYKTPLSDADEERVVEDSAREAGVPEGTDVREVRTTTDGAAVVELESETSDEQVEKLARKIADDPAVDYAEPDQLVSVAAASDAHYSSQWAHPATKVSTAWNSATGAGVTIGVVDTGFASHPDLDPQVAGGFDFVSASNLSNDGNGRDADPRDPGTYSSVDQCYQGAAASTSNWHGTHVAGTAAAARNSVGTVGVAPDAKLLNARALGACGLGYISDIADAVTWLAGAPVAGAPAPARPADVINLSLSFPGGCGTTFQRAIDTAYHRGVPVVVAAGNSGVEALHAAPGNCYNVITTGASTSSGQRASYSNHGWVVDIYAPGHSIISSGNSGTKAPATANSMWLSGTSMASPHVAGTVALMRQKNPNLTPAQLKSALLSTATSPAGVPVANTATALAAVPAATPFQDVPTTHAFHQEISWMASAGISGGWATADGAKEYRPRLAVDRDVMAAFLYRLAGSPQFTPPATSPFADITPQTTFYKEMAWMADAGISGGWTTPDGGKEYRPHAEVDRDVMAAFLYRLAGSPQFTPPATSPFADITPQTTFYREMAWMADAGISGGWSTATGKEYRPHVAVDRGVMAAFLHRLASQL
ncbi:S8 family serine peptidase [Kocuria sp. M1R5S2]|uniref:S8 family serine peptidase n=1 Tax=Kocuria rhizosphaerae TaxID=3376285 RepID=UPI0037A7DF24